MLRSPPTCMMAPPMAKALNPPATAPAVAWMPIKPLLLTVARGSDGARIARLVVEEGAVDHREGGTIGVRGDASPIGRLVVPEGRGGHHQDALVVDAAAETVGQVARGLVVRKDGAADRQLRA